MPGAVEDILRGVELIFAGLRLSPIRLSAAANPPRTAG
jgi:hypothetical protein